MNSRIELNKDKQIDIDKEKQMNAIKKVIKKIVFAILIIFLLAFFTFFYITKIGTTSIIVNEEIISSSKIPESFSGFKIIQFGDIHYDNYDLLKDTINTINKRNPDIILFTGDLLKDDNLTTKKRKNLVGELKKLNAPLKYAVLGEADNDEALSILLDCGFVILDNNNDYIYNGNNESIMLVGLNTNNEVINYWKYPLKYREKMDELIEKDMLLKGSTLFSKQEQDYFNFYLNQRSFNNTYDLRNKYLHGNKLKDDDENTHYNNYMLFLKLIILIIIKINDELCVKEDIKKNKNIKEKE